MKLVDDALKHTQKEYHVQILIKKNHLHFVHDIRQEFDSIKITIYKSNFPEFVYVGIQGIAEQVMLSEIALIQKIKNQF